MSLAPPVPFTASTGGFLTSALWNTQVRDATTFLTNPPRFNGSCTALPAAPANGVEVVIPIDTEDVDSEGGHSTTVNTSRYTCQVAGLYMISAHLAFNANATGMRAMDIKINGAIAPGGRVSSGQPTTSISLALNNVIHQYLNVGDYVEFSGYQYSGAALSLSTSTAYNPRLSLHWVSA